MTFDRNGMLFKIAYNWNPDYRKVNESIKPHKTSICSLFWLTVFAVLAAWPFIIFGRIFGWVVRIVGFLPALILCGYRPAGPGWRCIEADNMFPFVPISWWPKRDGINIMPIFVVAFLFALIVLLYIGYFILWEGLVKLFFIGMVFGTTIGQWSFWILLVLSAFLGVYSAVRNTEGYQMTKAFLKAKKDRLCPFVEFK